MRAAVYNRYLASMGGGERHSGMLAQVLAETGYDVDIVGPPGVTKQALADHLGLDLDRVRLREVPDGQESELPEISAGYDLFVNASYMSRLRPRARHNLYLTWFPTPTDADLTPWRRSLARTVGPKLRQDSAAAFFSFGKGWYLPDVGRLRSWSWSDGDGRVRLEAAPQRRMHFALGRPGASEATEVRLVLDDGSELARLQAGDRWQRHTVTAPPGGACEVRFESDVFVPGPADPRELGVAVSRLRVTGVRHGPRHRIANRFPWLLRGVPDLSFLESYDRVLANSEFTREWVRRLWNVDADVLFPPVDVEHVSPGNKQKQILAVGRFFTPGSGHNKKQLELVEAFGAMVRRGELPGWELHVVGGFEPAHRRYVDQVIAAAEGLPAYVHAGAPRSLVNDLFASSAIFWHATGLDEDDEREPWLLEHFGITTVEAMAAGCVPVVIDKGGQREIVRQGVDGFRWTSVEEMQTLTLLLAGDEALRERLARSAQEHAARFSESAFAERWKEIASKLGLED